MEHREIANLAQQAAAGDQKSFAALYEALFDSFYYSAYKILKSPEDAADVVQDVMIELYRDLGKLNNYQSFVAYANRKIFGKSVDCLRRQQRWSFVEDLGLAEEQETGDDFIPEAYLASRERRARVLQAVDTLSDHLRVLVMMHYYQQMSIAEIAQTLDMTQGAVKTGLSRARAKLKGML